MSSLRVSIKRSRSGHIVVLKSECTEPVLGNHANTHAMLVNQKSRSKHKHDRDPFQRLRETHLYSANFSASLREGMDTTVLTPASVQKLFFTPVPASTVVGLMSHGWKTDCLCVCAYIKSLVWHCSLFVKRIAQEFSRHRLRSFWECSTNCRWVKDHQQNVGWTVKKEQTRSKTRYW